MAKPRPAPSQGLDELVVDGAAHHEPPQPAVLPQEGGGLAHVVAGHPSLPLPPADVQPKRGKAKCLPGHLKSEPETITNC